MIIDAKDMILGRIGSYIAKQVLLGNKVDVINCEECIVSGGKYFTRNEYIRKMHRGAPGKAPYFYRKADMLVKRTIRGMLPFKRARGRDAFKNLKCHVGVPDAFKDEKALTIKSAGVERLNSPDYLKIKEICMAVSGK